MRIKVECLVDKLILPIAYKHIIQGVFYNMLERDELGDFYHNQGFQENEKKYKLFVFSDLFGNYKILDKKIIFSDKIVFYIGILDSHLVKVIHEYLINNKYLFINKQRVIIETIECSDLSYFRGIKTFKIDTLSPVVTYSSKNNYFKYYKPSDSEFEEYIKDNIIRKMSAYKYPNCQVYFELVKVLYEKKKLVHFKNTFYEGYQSSFIVNINYDTLKMIYDTGLSAKGSCGFGMIRCKNEKNILSL